MIIQSPESAMPEPYKTYVRQRSEAIASVLGQVIGDNDVQLCPRAITADEQVFPVSSSYIYGVVVKELSDGYKSVLYSNYFGSSGIATSNIDEATAYTKLQTKIGNRVRVKDPRESDGQGQFTVESVSELLPVFHEVTKESDFGCVLMPHINQIGQRISIGHIDLGGFGKYTYMGREETTHYNGNEVYGGTTLGLFHSSAEECETKAQEYFDIPTDLISLGKCAISKYIKLAAICGRVSVDVIQGITDSGEQVRDVIDITPRVGGTTPAETLAISEIHNDPELLCYASSKLIYDPPVSPKIGINFIDTDTLVINARVHEVIK